jgi:N6-adenosine-specific RNA methylase IME4
MYNTILIDPPWPINCSGKYKTSKCQRPDTLPYPTMTIADIADLPVHQLANNAAHLWLWTTNAFLKTGFDLISHWGFTYLAPIHFIKPSGIGNYFVHRTQTLLFAYNKTCFFPLARYQPNIVHVSQPARHSEKWPASYELIERISPAPRLELFARKTRPGWHVWGNEVQCDIEISPEAA